MTDNNKHLVRVGHEFAAAMSDDTPIITIAKMVTELASALDVQSAHSEALAAKLSDVCAENAALKEQSPDVRSPAMFEAIEAAQRLLDEGCPELAMVEAFEFLKMKRTPATDAWVNEQRAVVWITGNQPKEFGRYWVRYETDVGPQYCSAQWQEYNFCAGSDINIHKIWLADHSRSINQLRGVTHYTKLPPELEAEQLRGSQV